MGSIKGKGCMAVTVNYNTHLIFHGSLLWACMSYSGCALMNSCGSDVLLAIVLLNVFVFQKWSLKSGMVGYQTCPSTLTIIVYSFVASSTHFDVGIAFLVLEILDIAGEHEGACEHLQWCDHNTCSRTRQV